MTLFWIFVRFIFSVSLHCFPLLNLEFILVQHYDKRGQQETALSKIDEAIEHTPTVIDLYSVKVSSYLNDSSYILVLV